MGVGPERIAKTKMNRQKEITEDSEEERHDQSCAWGILTW